MTYTVERSCSGGPWSTVVVLGVYAPATYPAAVLAALTSTGTDSVARVLDGAGCVVRTFTHRDRARLLEPVRAAVARQARHRHRDRVRAAVADFTRRTRKTETRSRRRGDGQLDLWGPGR